MSTDNTDDAGGERDYLLYELDGEDHLVPVGTMKAANHEQAVRRYVDFHKDAAEREGKEWMPPDKIIATTRSAARSVPVIRRTETVIRAGEAKPL